MCYQICNSRLPTIAACAKSDEDGVKQDTTWISSLVLYVLPGSEIEWPWYL